MALRAVAIATIAAVGVALDPVVLAALLIFSLISLGAAMSGGEA